MGAKVTYKELTTATEINFLSILSSKQHSVEVSRERHNLIVSRVQWSAGALSVVTLAWIVIDAFTMSWPLWGILAIERMSAAAAFWMGSLPRQQNRKKSSDQ